MDPISISGEFICDLAREVRRCNFIGKGVEGRVGYSRSTAGQISTAVLAFLGSQRKVNDDFLRDCEVLAERCREIATTDEKNVVNELWNKIQDARSTKPSAWVSTAAPRDSEPPAEHVADDATETTPLEDVQLVDPTEAATAASAEVALKTGTSPAEGLPQTPATSLMLAGKKQQLYCSSEITAEDLAPFQAAPLEVLTLTSDLLELNAFKMLDLRRLKRLDLHGSEFVTREVLAHVGKAPLEVLDLTGTEALQSGDVTVLDPIHIRELILSANDWVKKADLSHFAVAPLETLNILYCHSLQGQDLRVLKNLGNLKNVYLNCNSWVTWEDVGCFADAPLERLDLTATALPWAKIREHSNAMKVFSGKQLQTIDLLNCPGLDEQVLRNLAAIIRPEVTVNLDHDLAEVWRGIRDEAATSHN